MKRKVDELGRITIPKEIRKQLLLNIGDELEVTLDNDSIILKPSTNKVRKELAKGITLLNAAINMNDEDTVKIYTGYVKALKFVLGEENERDQKTN